MEAARTADLVKFPTQFRHTIADHAAIGLDLRLARTAKEAETAALALEMGPGAHEAPGLVIEMRQFDLKTPLGRRRAFTEDLEDQAGPVDDLALELFLQIALLDRGQRAVDDDQFGLGLRAGNRDVADLAFTEQRRRARLADRDDEGVDHLDPDRQGEALALLEPGLGVLRGARSPGAAPKLGANDDRPRAAGDLAFQVLLSHGLCEVSPRRPRRSRRSDRPG